MGGDKQAKTNNSEQSSPDNMASNKHPPSKKSHVERQKMTYHCKFGEFETELRGIAVNAENNIIVVNSRDYTTKQDLHKKIKVFDKEGKFKFQFGDMAHRNPRNGQLVQPIKVAVFKDTGDIVVAEGGGAHQVQVYSKHGNFIRKFGANILQNPNGICVDSMGHVIVVDCKQKWLVIFDRYGNLLKLLGCEQYLQSPNDVVVNDHREIFISDNTCHCVKVFDYDGNFLRQIGGKGITNYPVGVGMNFKGDLFVADNHINFHLTTFSQDGHLLSSLESKDKHAECIAVMDTGSFVVASKSKCFIYKYLPTIPCRTSQSRPSYATPPPHLGDKSGYICVTNDENIGGLFHLPLNPDHTFSALTLRNVFPNATGLYYYSSDNLILGVFQDEQKLFPPKSGDEIIYITTKMSYTAQNYEGSVILKGQSVGPGNCDFSELKHNVEEMRLTMNQLRREVIELKEEKTTSQSCSVLDVNANIFVPAKEGEDNPIADKGDKTSVFTIKGKEAEDDSVNEDRSKDTIFEDAAMESITEDDTKKNDNMTNTRDQAWKLQGITASYYPSMKETSKPVLKGKKGEALCQTEEYRRERIRLRRLGRDSFDLQQTQFISGTASSQSSYSSSPGVGSSLSGESLMSLKRLSIEQKSVKPLASVESRHVNVHLEHDMSGAKVEPDLPVTGAYGASEDRCSGDKAVDVNANRLPTKARGRNIKILKGVKTPGGLEDK